MAALSTNLSALVMGMVRAVQAVVTEILPPAATLTGDVAYAACASAATAWSAAWSAVQASLLSLRMALKLLRRLWRLSSAVAAVSARAAKDAATVMAPAAVTLADSVVRAAWASVAWFLAAAEAVAVDTLPRAVAAVRDAAETAARASRPWLELSLKLLHELHVWVITVAVERLPDAAQAAKSAAWSVVESSQPWLEKVSKLSRDLYERLSTTAAAEELPTDAACAMATEKLRSDAAAAEASVARLQGVQAASWLVRDHGVALYALLALALLAIAFLCGAVCALVLCFRHPDSERRHGRRPSRPPYHD
ncbi:hypothetical protein ACP70R_012213 [Stipagrostis hirtigluma subsp. patula]